MYKKALLLAGALTFSASAHAQLTTISFDLYGTNFTPYSGNPSPLVADPVHLNFSLTLDPDYAINYGPVVDGLVVNSFNLPYALAYSFSVDGVMSIATAGVPGGCYLVPNSFCAFIYSPFSASPTLSFMEQSGAEGSWSAQTMRLTVSPRSVPEPTTWGMMLLGFGGLGGAMRYRRSRMTLDFA